MDVCPVDCIHPRKDEPEFAAAEMLYIHPDECIDCGACVPACPVEAIFALDETPDKWTNSSANAILPDSISRAVRRVEPANCRKLQREMS